MPCDLKNFCQYIQNLLSADRLPDVAVNGLQVEGKKRISSIATAVTSSLNVIKQAVDLKVDALIVHHGLFMKGKEYIVTGVAKEKLGLLLKYNISLFTYHIPLDVHHELGNNWPVAKQLGWNNLAPFGLYEGIPIGVKGLFPSMPRSKLKAMLEKVYKKSAHVAFGGNDNVVSCALVSGHAHKMIYEAIATGVDCFVTGTADEPIWHIAHEEKINFFSFGHAATEDIGVKLLGSHLKNEFDLKHHFIEEFNPF